MEWFCFGIDPLVRYLERRLQGILISSLPVLGPSAQGEVHPLPPLEDRFRLMAYCDDIKPSISTMAEFLVVDKACSLFEKSSGCLSSRKVQISSPGQVERFSPTRGYSSQVHDLI